MTNLYITPNHMTHKDRNSTHTAWFANVRCCQPDLFNDHIRIQFAADSGHVDMELNRETATELDRRLQESIGALPPRPNLGGHAWTGDEQ